MNYIEFANKSIERFKEVQKDFQDKFKIATYTNWFYDQTTEILTLSTDEEEINFKYIPIGTFSSETKTWMWSWENAGSKTQIKNKTLKVQEIGLKYDYSKLKKGHFEGDKYDGWEFIAISNKILNGIGAYKVKTDHLEIFLLITQQIDQETAHRIQEKIIDCDFHGINKNAYVCQHLINSSNKGFEEAFPTFKGMKLEDDDDLQAWCTNCEVERLRTNGWNEESMKFANIKLICEACYFEIKEKSLVF